LRLRSSIAPAVALAALALFAACGGKPASAPPVAYDVNALPTGQLGESIKLGHDIIMDPQKYVPKSVVADMSCGACHISGGTVNRGGSLVGVYARFPQWNKRAKRVITLQDRLAECFLYSMNGTPPAYTSKEMTAMVAYIAYLSRDVPVGAKVKPGVRFVVPLPSAPPDLAHGAAIYTKSCEMCHQANGAGVHGSFPPLWGPTSFNRGAGMSHLDLMTGFVEYNMPKNAPGTLSMQDAYDVSAWVLTHARPKFAKDRTIVPPSEPASYF